jgi:hypothetical protein
MECSGHSLTAENKKDVPSNPGTSLFPSLKLPPLAPRGLLLLIIQNFGKFQEGGDRESKIFPLDMVSLILRISPNPSFY